ncbi:MAG: glycosyltransferase [bacterium]
MKNKIVVVYSSHLSLDKDKKFEEYISNTIGCRHEIHRYENKNKYSLSYIYNDAIKNYNSPNNIFVFIHNDISFDTDKWGMLLLTKFNNSKFDIIGLAGTDYFDKSGKWWNNKRSLYGIVNHDNGFKKWETRFSNPFRGLKECVVIDGVFIALDADELGSCFNENYGKFHFYDISMCLEAYLNGFNIGVTTDIRITHKSIGVTNKEWDENRLKLIDEYKEELPISINNI